MCKWLREYHDEIIVILTFIGLIVTSFGLFVIYCQLNQSVKFKKYDNFKHYNKVYDDWYKDMPKEINQNDKISFPELDEKGRAWVRRYFNLYAQEYYLFQNNLIPRDMWSKQIHGCNNKQVNAAFRNLKKYPSLLQGYVYWKNKHDAFIFPQGFTDMLDKDLEKCEISLPKVKHAT